MKKRAIGLELTDQAVILCEAVRESGSVRIKRQDLALLPEDVLVMGELKDPVTLSQILASLLPNPFFAPTPILVSISGLQAFVRKFSIPLVPEREIAKVVHWEGESILPYPIMEVFYHYQIMERIDDRYHILFTALRRERVEPYLHVFSTLDLPVRFLTIHPFGLSNCLLSTGECGAFSGVLTRFRRSACELVLFVDGQPELVRTVVIPGVGGLHEIAASFRDELISTLEHFQTEREIWLDTGVFFGSTQILREIREEMPAFHWRHFYSPHSGRDDEIRPPALRLKKAVRLEDGIFGNCCETDELHQELPCALGLAMLGVGE